MPCMADSLEPVNVRKLKAMPDGNYLTIMQRNGADRRLYLLVEEGKATCIHTNTWLAADPSVQFKPLAMAPSWHPLAARTPQRHHSESSMTKAEPPSKRCLIAASNSKPSPWRILV